MKILGLFRPAPAKPTNADALHALDALDRAGGDGAVYPDGTVRVGGAVIDATPRALRDGIFNGWVEPRFGHRYVVTRKGRAAAIRHRWSDAS